MLILMTNNNVNVLDGKPGKVIKNLAIPIFIYLLISNSYNIIDGMWITGIGKAAIAGVGTIMPLYSAVTGIGSGIGTGATSTISYFIGLNDKKNADNTAVNSLILMIFISIIITIILLLSLRYYLSTFNIDENAFNQSMMYGIPLFLNSVTFIFVGGITGILRGEGETKKPMIASSIGLILDAILDPFFIYTLGMGITGAAISTVLTSIISLLILFYWMFIKKDTYLNFSFKSFKLNIPIIKRILNVGIPASIELLTMTLATTGYLWFVSSIGGNYGTAIFTAGNKLYYIGLIPISAICMALVPVVGNAFGEHDYDKIKESFNYSCKIAVILGIFTTLCIFIFAEPLSFTFAYTVETSDLLNGLVEFLRITVLAIPFLGIGLPSTFLYQGLSKGFQSLVWTLFREVISSIFFIYLFGFYFSLGLIGIWIGLLVGRTIANILNFIFAKYTLSHL